MSGVDTVLETDMESEGSYYNESDNDNSDSEDNNIDASGVDDEDGNSDSSGRHHPKTNRHVRIQ